MHSPQQLKFVLPRHELTTSCRHLQLYKVNNVARMPAEEDACSSSSPWDASWPNLLVLRRTDQLHELQTLIRSSHTSRSQFVFVADRLIRLVIEEGLNKLPYSSAQVSTPTDHRFEGLVYARGNCGVSIVRSGEIMEKALRHCCRSIRIGKILIDSHPETKEARLIFAKMPSDVDRRKVLLLYPIMASGNKVCRALHVLKEHGVKEANVVVINLFSTPEAATRIAAAFPDLILLTSEVHPVVPDHFGRKYFGTD